MKTIIGVMGPGSKNAQSDDIACAYEIGKIVAKTESALLCGGMTGVMEASAKGANEAGGLVIGIGPTTDKAELNKYIDIPIMTGMHAGRNLINILSSDIILFVSVRSAGTLSELAHAIQMEKPSLVIRGDKNLKEYISELDTKNVRFVDTLVELESELKKMLATL